MTQKVTDKTVDPTSPTVTFDYIKGNFFRVIHADGGMVSPTPDGSFHLAFYSERGSIPRRVIYELKDDGSLGNVKDIETRDSIVREIDIDAIFTRDVAEALVKSLQNALNHVDEQK